MAELGEPLSDREHDVLGCIVNGGSNKEIAAELHISQNTVKVHLRNIYTKLGVSSRTEAVTTALQQGLITIPGAEETAVSPPEPAPQDDPPIENAEAAEGAAETDAETAPDSAPAPRNWVLIGGFAVIALAALAAAIYFGVQALNPATTPTMTPAMTEGYQEEVIGQSRWFTTHPLLAPLAGMAVASVGIDVYHIGGETETGVTSLTNRYDTTTRTWHEMAAKPTAVSDTTAAVLFGEIYLPGGRTATGDPTNVVEAYSPANNAWRPIANLPKPISSGLALSDGSYLYMIGGWDGANYLDDVFVYDAGSDSWRPLANLPVPLASAAGGVISGQLFVLGGTNGDEARLDTCYVYTVAEDAWNACPSMLHPRVNAGAAVVLNKLYVLGGDAVEGPERPFGEFYDTDTQTWQVVNMPMLTEATTWQNLGVANVETRIYALGGKIGDTLSDRSYIYAPLVYQTFIPAASNTDE